MIYLQLGTISLANCMLLLDQIMHTFAHLHPHYTHTPHAYHSPDPVALGGTEGGAPPLVDDGVVTVVDRKPDDCCCCVDDTLGVAALPAFFSHGFSGVAVAIRRT